jgi:hypothetical protein
MGNNPNRGKGTNRENFQKSREEVEGSKSQKNRGENYRGGDSRGRRPFPRGRGGEINCYAYGKTCRMSWECPENKSAWVREAQIYESH